MFGSQRCGGRAVGGDHGRLQPAAQARRAGALVLASTDRGSAQQNAKVEWNSGELYPRVGFIVTNLARPVEPMVAFYNQSGTAEQWIKEGKAAIRWTRLSCRSFAANAVRL
jgi:DDE family transposase